MIVDFFVVVYYKVVISWCYWLVICYWKVDDWKLCVVEGNFWFSLNVFVIRFVMMKRRYYVFYLFFDGIRWNIFVGVVDIGKFVYI